MLHTELHSIQPPPTPTSSAHGHIHTHFETPLKPLTNPSAVVMDKLTKEMQNMIIENRLKKEVALRSFWEGAVGKGLIKERGKDKETERERDKEMEKERERERAVSMLGLTYNPSNGVAVRGELEGLGGRRGRIGSPGRLPSPRPSPPPPSGMLRRTSSYGYIRARSVSC